MEQVDRDVEDWSVSCEDESEEQVDKDVEDWPPTGGDDLVELVDVEDWEDVSSIASSSLICFCPRTCCSTDN